MNILTCEGVSRVYGSGNNQVTALAGIDLEVDRGEFVAITGASGSGKSTLLHILGGVDKPTGGRVIVEGTDLSGLNQTKAAIFRRRKVGLVYQFYNLIPTLTVRKNILMPLTLDKKKPNEAYFEEIVKALGISEKLDAMPNQLSGGQQQRVAIARSLIYRPALLLADEPTGNLDQKNSGEILDMLKLSNRNLKQTILLITHDEKIALGADRIIIIEDGHIVSDERRGVGKMWREYSSGYLKNNRATAVSVIIAASISSLLLSLLGSLFYNMWKYEVERLREEGDQYALMAMYLVRDASDEAPRLVFPLFLFIMGLASFSLILIIHNAFAVSMQARIHQFGILASIGATPKQIRRCLLQEAVFLCTASVVAGTLLGIAGSMGLLALLEVLLRNVEGRRAHMFSYHPLILAFSFLAAGITVGISAWMPARKLSRMMPLEAIRNTQELQLRRKKHSPVLSLLFGIEGELAGNALKAQKKALRMASVSLILSMTAFSLMQCFFTLSEISTRETYFEKYQDIWDIMITVKDTKIGSLAEIEQLREIPGVENVIVYQKAMARRCITEEEISEEMKANGGFSNDSGKYVAKEGDGFLVNAPVIILDDEAFLEYCEQIGAPMRTDGAVIRNRIRDVTNPDFRHPQYMPYIRECQTTVLLAQTDGAEDEEMPVSDGAEIVEIPVLACVEEVPRLREEYATLDPYELVHFVPARLWKRIGDQMGGAEKNTLIRILGREGVSIEELETIQGEIERKFAGVYTMESENRIREYETNDQKIQGMMLVLGSFCVLLAIIGVGDVFSNTLGFVWQRKREFARYLSVGMTPQELRKMFCIEALVLAGRPMLWAATVAVFAVGAMLRASYMDVAEFLAEAPCLPVGAFMLAVGGAVAFAYYLSWRKMREIDLAEVLRDDTMV